MRTFDKGKQSNQRMTKYTSHYLGISETEIGVLKPSTSSATFEHIQPILPQSELVGV